MTEFLVQYRIMMAKQLLVQRKDWSIQEVSEACGFNSQNYFSTTFKRLTHVSPMKYREITG